MSHGPCWAAASWSGKGVGSRTAFYFLNKTSGPAATTIRNRYVVKIMHCNPAVIKNVLFLFDIFSKTLLFDWSIMEKSVVFKEQNIERCYKSHFAIGQITRSVTERQTTPVPNASYAKPLCSEGSMTTRHCSSSLGSMSALKY